MRCICLNRDFFGLLGCSGKFQSQALKLGRHYALNLVGVVWYYYRILIAGRGSLPSLFCISFLIFWRKEPTMSVVVGFLLKRYRRSYRMVFRIKKYIWIVLVLISCGATSQPVAEAETVVEEVVQTQAIPSVVWQETPAYFLPVHNVPLNINTGDAQGDGFSRSVVVQYSDSQHCRVSVFGKRGSIDYFSFSEHIEIFEEFMYAYENWVHQGSNDLKSVLFECAYGGVNIYLPVGD
jgi:hypothetical protein